MKNLNEAVVLWAVTDGDENLIGVSKSRQSARALSASVRRRTGMKAHVRRLMAEREGRA